MIQFIFFFSFCSVVSVVVAIYLALVAPNYVKLCAHCTVFHVLELLGVGKPAPVKSDLIIKTKTDSTAT